MTTCGCISGCGAHTFLAVVITEIYCSFHFGACTCAHGGGGSHSKLRNTCMAVVMLDL